VRYIFHIFTFACFVGFMFCLGIWVRDGGTRPLVAATILVVMMALMTPVTPRGKDE